MKLIILFGITCGASLGLLAMPNPASVYCGQNGGYVDIHTASDGSEYGICSFMEEDPSAVGGSRNSQCEEWSFLRGTCKKGDCQVIRELTDVYSDNELHLFCANEIK